MSESNPRAARLSQLVEELVEGYLAEPLTRHMDAGPLPNRDGVIEIIERLRELIFPGYFGEQNLSASTIRFRVGERLVQLRTLLMEQVRAVLRHRRGETPQEAVEVESIVDRFLNRLPWLRQQLATDVRAAFEGDPAASGPDEIIFSYPGLFAVTVYRIAHELLRLGVPLLPRIMTEHAHSVTGADIHPGADIDGSFFIDHATGVVIGETTRIGKGVKIYQGVTLGALSTRGGQSLRGVKRHPTLEDGVTVYSGASILGGDTVIGEGAVIASNVFVTQSVPAGTRVTMRNPELQMKNRAPQEFVQDVYTDFVI